MAYVKHKPQYRMPGSAGRGGLIGRPRDIRRALPDARAKVVIPDKSGLPRSFRFSGSLQRSRPFGRATFAFSPPRYAGRAASSFNWAGGSAQLGPALRFMGAAMLAYDLWNSVDNLLGGDPYGIRRNRPYGGGPIHTPPASNRNYAYWNALPFLPGRTLVVPFPDGTPGWSVGMDANWQEGAALNYFTHNNGSKYWARPFGEYHKGPPNSSAWYTIQEVLALGPPPNVNLQYRTWHNRLQSGLVNINNPQHFGASLAPYEATFYKPVSAPIGRVEAGPRPFTIPGTSAPPDYAAIDAAWPQVPFIQPSILPTHSPWVPIPWGAVNAVNAVRGALGIREENFMDDVGNPRPVPKPEVVHKPPPPGQKEKKAKSNNGRLLLFYRSVKKAWHEIDEHLEKVDILYDALPSWVRNRERAKLPHEKIAALLRNWEHIDVSEALYGLIENEVEDAVIGRGFKSLEDAFEKLGVRGWRGDLAMQYSTDALFDLYGAVKGGL